MQEEKQKKVDQPREKKRSRGEGVCETVVNQPEENQTGKKAKTKTKRKQAKRRKPKRPIAPKRKTSKLMQII